jgi:hypothetical protein
LATSLIDIPDELALKIATRVKGHPDYAQRLCSHILDGLEAKTLSEALVEQSVSRMLSSLTPSFAGIFEELPLPSIICLVPISIFQENP